MKKSFFTLFLLIIVFCIALNAEVALEKQTNAYVEMYAFKNTTTGDSIQIGSWTTGQWATETMKTFKEEMVKLGFTQIPVVHVNNEYPHKMISLGQPYSMSQGPVDNLDELHWVTIIAYNKVPTKPNALTWRWDMKFSEMPAENFNPKFAALLLE